MRGSPSASFPDQGREDQLTCLEVEFCCFRRTCWAPEPGPLQFRGPSAPQARRLAGRTRRCSSDRHSYWLKLWGMSTETCPITVIRNGSVKVGFIYIFSPPDGISVSLHLQNTCWFRKSETPKRAHYSAKPRSLMWGAESAVSFWTFFLRGAVLFLVGFLNPHHCGRRRVHPGSHLRQRPAEKMAPRPSRARTILTLLSISSFFRCVPATHAPKEGGFNAEVRLTV